MIRLWHGKLILCAVVSCLLVMFSHAGATEKVFSFDKDIEVLPVNSRSSARVNVTLSVDKTKVKPGDTVKVYFQSDADCYLDLMDVGTSGKTTRLWPNEFSGKDNFVKAGRRYAFPGPNDKFQFRVSGPEGIERIVAVAASKKDAIISETEFSEYRGGFKSYRKELKDLVVEARQRTSHLPPDVKWGTASTTITVGNVPAGGRITSRNVYLLSVGASTGSLRYCEDDAREFLQLLSEKLEVPRENTRLIVGKQATKAGFQDSLKWLASKTRPEDLVVIYFSGHGTLIPDAAGVRHEDGLSAAFVCYHDKTKLSLEDPDIKDILLPGPEFASILKDIPARRKVFVVDSCHSGSIHKEVSPNLVSKYLPLLSSARVKELQVIAPQTPPAGQVGAGRYSELLDSKEALIAACEKREHSYEDRSKKAGLFTYWLANYIKSGSIDLRAASEKTRQSVSDETRALTGKQTPHIDDEQGLTRDVKF